MDSAVLSDSEQLRSTEMNLKQTLRVRSVGGLREGDRSFLYNFKTYIVCTMYYIPPLIGKSKPVGYISHYVFGQLNVKTG